MFGFVCFISITESFLIIFFRSEAVLWIYTNALGCKVNGNILLPHSNSSSR